MTGLHTNESLLSELRANSSRTPSFDQFEKQRLSFVMGVLPDDNTMTRAEVLGVLEMQEGRKSSAR